MQIVKAIKSLVPSVELTNDENRTSHLTGTWTDNAGYRDEHKLSFRYVRNSEKLARMHGKPNMKTKDIEYTDEWGNKHVLTAQRAKEIMLLAKCNGFTDKKIAEEANALSDLYEAADIKPDDILLDIKANPA